MSYTRMCQQMGCGLPAGQQVAMTNGRMMWCCDAHAKKRGETVLRYRGRRMYK